MQSGDLATWASAAGTFAAVVAALWLARRDSRERRREDRRHQAEQITAWISARDLGERGTQRHYSIEIQNASNQLAYRVVVSIVQDPRSLHGDLPRDNDLPRRPGRPDTVGGAVEAYRFRAFIGELPPGRTQTVIEYPGRGMSIRWALELCFRDAAGRSWLRRRGGLVEEISDPLAHYGLNEPVGWQSPGEDLLAPPTPDDGLGEA